jgi:dolichyl-phosphate beta-glucosyltransferase
MAIQDRNARIFYSKDEEKMKLSIIIPAYNEEKRIGKTLERILEYLHKRIFDYEIIVVDDGSKDKTIEVVSKFKDKRIKILKNIKNMGKGYSIKRGMLEATKDYLLFSDSDLSTPIEELDDFIKYILRYDIIIASRNLKESKIKIKQPKIRQLLGKIFPLFVRLFAIRGIKDTQCGFKLFKKDSAKKIFGKQTIDGFGFDVEILYLAKKYKFKIKEMPVVWVNDMASKVNPFKDSLRMIRDVIKVRINDLTGKYI